MYGLDFDNGGFTGVIPRIRWEIYGDARFPKSTYMYVHPRMPKLTSNSKVVTPIQISASQNVSKKEGHKIADPENRFG